MQGLGSSDLGPFFCSCLTDARIERCVSCDAYTEAIACAIASAAGKIADRSMPSQFTMNRCS